MKLQKMQWWIIAATVASAPMATGQTDSWDDVPPLEGSCDDSFADCDATADGGESRGATGKIIAGVTASIAVVGGAVFAYSKGWFRGVSKQSAKPPETNTSKGPMWDTPPERPPIRPYASLEPATYESPQPRIHGDQDRSQTDPRFEREEEQQRLKDWQRLEKEREIKRIIIEEGEARFRRQLKETRKVPTSIFDTPLEYLDRALEYLGEKKDEFNEWLDQKVEDAKDWADPEEKRRKEWEEFKEKIEKAKDHIENRRREPSFDSDPAAVRG